MNPLKGCVISFYIDMKNSVEFVQRHFLNWEKVWNKKSKSLHCVKTGGRKDINLLNHINQQVVDVMHFNANDIVLDIGCGAGQLVNKISCLVKRAVGLDLSWGMLKYAGKSANASFIQSDMKLLPFKDASFTKIISVSSLVYLNEFSIEKLFIQLDRLLMQGGFIYLGQLIDRYKSNKILNFKCFNKPQTFSDLKEITKKIIAFKFGFLTTYSPSIFDNFSKKYGYEIERLKGISPQAIYKENYLHFTVKLTKL